MGDADREHTPLREISNMPRLESHQGSLSKPGIEDQHRYTTLMKKARQAAEEGHPRLSLEHLNKAAKIYNSEKVQKRIMKIEEYLRENGSGSESEDDSGMHHVGKGFYVHNALYEKLYSYQREALMWFWRLHRKNKGGILGDDMGLGKTIQMISFMSGLFELDQVKTVLLVLPVALIINWEKEFEKWAPAIFVESHHSNSKRERERALAKVQRRGGVLLTSYGLVLTNHALLSHRNGNPFTWDYVILDEGHKIKNPSKTTKAVHKVPAYHRLILTGTPIQNNLKELWALFDFVTQGSLLGTSQTFNSEFANPITRAREKDATAGERCLGNQMAESLRELIAPYFLRRTKADVIKRRDTHIKNAKSLADQEKDEDTERVPEFPTLEKKNDFVIWLPLTGQQIKIYRDFIELDQVKELLMTSRSPLVELTILKKLCDHPRLLPVRACMQLGIETADNEWVNEDDDTDSTAPSKSSASHALNYIPDEKLMEESCKLQFLISLLTNLKREGHRTLVFSQSRKMLDIIEKVLKNQNFQLMRLDGTISKLDDREKRISSFQRNRELSVFLLTTQVGGVGLTLTGADRVVIYDPSWNPATDSQAVDRVYRIGQKRSVVIYRLISCGTVEEKIYRRQIFKDSLTKQATGTSKNPYRYFCRQELHDLFILDNPHSSSTQLQLQDMHAAQRKTDIELDEHIAYLYSLDIFGLSDHDLMFSQEADTENQEEQEQAAEYVQHRVNRAQELVSAESGLTQKLKDHIELDTEGPGSMQRHHRQYGDRQTLLEHAAKLGETVDVPAFNKRRDDYERTNQSSSESEEEEEEDLNMSMANMTLEVHDGNFHSSTSKRIPAADLLNGRPPSAKGTLDDNVICIEDSDDDEDEASSIPVNQRSMSDPDTVADSDTEDVMSSPEVRPKAASVSESCTERSGIESEVKTESNGKVPERQNPSPVSPENHDTTVDRLTDESRLKRLATTPKCSQAKMGRFSQSDEESSSNGDDEDDFDASIQEVPATPATIIDLTDSDADLSSSFTEIEQRTMATSPMVPSRRSVSPISPTSRPVSSATDVGILEQNVESDYYMESEEEILDTDKEPVPSLFPTLQEPLDSQQESLQEPFCNASDETPNPEHSDDANLSTEVIQRNVALSPMVHNNTASESEGSPEFSTPLGEQSLTEEKEGSVSKLDGLSDASLGKEGIPYSSDGDYSHGSISDSGSMQLSHNVTCKLSFDDTTISKPMSRSSFSDKECSTISEESPERTDEVNSEVNEDRADTSDGNRDSEDYLLPKADKQLEDGNEDIEKSMSFMVMESDNEEEEHVDQGGGEAQRNGIDKPSLLVVAESDDEVDSGQKNNSTDFRNPTPIMDSEDENSKLAEDGDVDEGQDSSTDFRNPTPIMDSEDDNSKLADEECSAEEHDESDESIAIPVSRRRRIIEESEEEGDDSFQEKEEQSLLEKVPSVEDSGEDLEAEEMRKSDQSLEEEDEEESLVDKSSSDDGRVERGSRGVRKVNREAEEKKNEMRDGGQDVEEEEEDDEYEDSFIDDDCEDSDEESDESEEEGSEYEASTDSEEEDKVTLTEEQIQEYEKLVAKGRLHHSNGNVKKALSYFLKALDIDSSDKALQRLTYQVANKFKQQR
ncbi:DNA excision repair protein ERCC-6-like isoform X1 [Asterias rubens]|uniref:DNA excision repair protein ERCC-6-like isoform X1 n=1 Tax=Asterias rubens TaxID=7604 RepID=UPI0014556BFE|nr:DNA excision repair protein ERCC-6-like isoform X1 [Asterias rubens]